MVALLPKEHGAYGQVAFPLLTTMAVAGVTLPASLLAVAVIAVFLAHEPLVVLLGFRGQRARREQAGAARVWLGVWGAAFVVAAAIAFFSLPVARQWAVLVPLVPAIPAAWAVLAGREKTSLAEVAVSLAFSGAAFPLALAAGATTATAATVTVVYAANFVLATLAVRALILNVRGGGNPAAVRTMARIVWAIAGGLLIAVVWACVERMLPWTTLAGVAPAVAVSLFLVFHPPPPARLRGVGWTLVATSAITAAVLIGGLRAFPGA